MLLFLSIEVFNYLPEGNAAIVAGDTDEGLDLKPLLQQLFAGEFTEQPVLKDAPAEALGATKWQTIRKVVLPNAVTGVLTGGILAVSRGAGEVAPILFTGAAYFLPKLPTSLSDQFMELGYHIYIMSTQSPDVEATMGIQYATTLALLLLTFGLNFSAIFLRYHMRKRKLS